MDCEASAGAGSVATGVVSVGDDTAGASERGAAEMPFRVNANTALHRAQRARIPEAGILSGSTRKTD